MGMEDEIEVAIRDVPPEEALETLVQLLAQSITDSGAFLPAVMNQLYDAVMSLRPDTTH